jgi:hypothetical protein
MLPGWTETDAYVEDLEKTEIIQELLEELAGQTVEMPQEHPIQG